MLLPYGIQVDRQQIIDKLTTYSLNFEHKDGRHKARLFRAKLGIVIDNQEVLVLALIEAAQKNEIVYSQVSEYGDKYVIDFDLTTEVGTAKIRSCWIVRFGETYPRLTTVYPIN
jgi:hypothetical protein